VPGITVGMVNNVVAEPIRFSNVASKIMQPCSIVLIQVKLSSCVPDCYDTKIPRGLGWGSVLTNPGLRVSVSNLVSWDGSKFITRVGKGCQKT